MHIAGRSASRSLCHALHQHSSVRDFEHSKDGRNLTDCEWLCYLVFFWLQATTSHKLEQQRKSVKAL